MLPTDPNKNKQIITFVWLSILTIIVFVFGCYNMSLGADYYSKSYGSSVCFVLDSTEYKCYSNQYGIKKCTYERRMKQVPCYEEKYAYNHSYDARVRERKAKRRALINGYDW